MIETAKIEPLNVRTAVAIGYFDGVHKGHQMILGTAVDHAKQMELHPAVFTFDMPSRRAEGKGTKDLITARDKKRLIAENGIELFVSPSFESFCGLSGRDFVDKVLSRKCLNAAVVVCGEDFRFGKDRQCGVSELKRYCGPYGIQVFAQEALVINGERVSSSRIKAELQKGEIETVNELLGYQYSVSGKVIHGNHKARELGFPTANIPFPEECVLPRKGVYISEVSINGENFRGITNIGTRPTLTEDSQPVVETHVIGISRDLYEADITVRLLSFVRPEMRFASVGELTQAVRQDIEQARDYKAGSRMT